VCSEISNKRFIQTGKWHYKSSEAETFLSEIARLGFKGIQISNEQCETPLFLQELTSQDLVPAEQYCAIECITDGPIQGSAASSEETIRLAAQAGAEMIVFAVGGSDDRDSYAGRTAEAPKLTAVGYAALANHISTFAKMAHESGMKSSFHPHAATYVESPEETRILMNLLEIDLVGLCMDTGHWIVGGGDSAAAIAEYGSRVTHVHVKDVDAEVLRSLISQEIKTMTIAVDDYKMFTPAGVGMLDLRGLFQALDQIGFEGWLMSEQDTSWEAPTEASAISIRTIEYELKNQFHSTRP
jgi:inosose dehydratase